jgi:hypothetical protein
VAAAVIECDCRLHCALVCHGLRVFLCVSLSAGLIKVRQDLELSLPEADKGTGVAMSGG